MKLLMLSGDAAHYGKTIRRAERGLVTSSLTHPIRNWRAYPTEVNDLRSFSRLALEIEERHPATALALGQLSQLGSELTSQERFIKRSHRGEAPHIESKPQSLLMLDIEYDDGLSELSDQERIERFIQLLPSCFHASSYHYQFSSSHRLRTSKDQLGSCLRVHIFFWSDQAIELELWRSYLAKLNKTHQEAKRKDLIDLSPITASGALIMTRPRFAGNLTDPLLSRSGLVIKETECVILPSSAHERPLARPTPQMRVLKRGYTESDDWAETQLQNVARRASQLQSGSGRNAQIFNDARWLGRLVGAERLYEADVTRYLLEAYELNGYMAKNKRGRADVERSIRRGIEEGSLDPLFDEYKTASRPARSIQSHHSSTQRMTSSDLKPSSPTEITSRTQALITEAMMKLEPRTLVVAESMTGAGKTGALINQAISLYQAGRSVIYLARNHQLIRGEGGLESRFNALGFHPDIWEGKERRCGEMQRAKADQSDNGLVVLNTYKELIKEQSIPQFCREIQCARYDSDQCNVWREDARPIEGRLIVAPQSYLNSLIKREEKDDLPDDLTLIIDERHDLMHTTGYALELIDALRYRTEDAKYLSDLRLAEIMPEDPNADFRSKHRPVSEFASLLHATLQRLATTQHQNQYGSKTTLTASLLKSLDDRLLSSAQDALKWIETYEVKVKALSYKAIKKAKALKTIRGERVKQSGLRIVQDLAELITEELNPLHMLHLSVTSDGCTVQRRTIQELPQSPKIILADATPTESWLGLYIKQIGFKLKLLRSEITPHPVDALHIRTKQMRQSALFKARTQELKASSVKSLDNLSHPLSLMLRTLSAGDEIGLISSKGLYDQIKAGLKGRGALANTELIRGLQRYALKLGYYGRDERGSNEFEKCKALILLGDPRPNLGEMRADIEALTKGLDDQRTLEEITAQLYQEHSDAATIQAFGRLRSLWRSDLILIHATERALDLKGARWSVYEASGRSIPHQVQAVEQRAHDHLDSGQALSYELMNQWGVSSPATTKRIINRISMMRPIESRKIKQPKRKPITVWIDPSVRADIGSVNMNDIVYLDESSETRNWSSGPGDLRGADEVNQVDQSSASEESSETHNWSSQNLMSRSEERGIQHRSEHPDSSIIYKGLSEDSSDANDYSYLSGLKRGVQYLTQRPIFSADLQPSI